MEVRVKSARRALSWSDARRLVADLFRPLRDLGKIAGLYGGVAQ
jgi:hypothetical protein